MSVAHDYWRERVAIVTGASSGLGFALATALGAAGARVALAARGREALDAAAAQLTSQGHQVLAVPTDVTVQADVERLIETVVGHWGQLDLLVNNAGRSARRAVLDTSPDDFRELLDVNLLSVVRLTRAAAPHLIARQGHMVSISSLAGKAPARFMGAYGPSKAALTSYTEQLRLELAATGLHVLLVCPGPIARATPRQRDPAGVANLPASALQPGAGVKTSAIAPERLACLVLAACERRQPELVLPAKARWLFAIRQLFPRFGDYLLTRLS